MEKMPPKRKGYSYIDQGNSVAVIRDEDGMGLGAFANSAEVLDAIAADKAAPEPARTHLDEQGPDLRASEPEPAPDGTRVR